MKKSRICLAACAIALSFSVAGSSYADDWKMFDRRVGMFVHWGVYASLGYHEQARMRLFLSREDYRKQAMPKFTAEKFNADAFVDIAESLGATYIVITSKHHDGFCM